MLPAVTAAGQDPFAPSVPCPPDSVRDDLLAADLKVASQEAGRSGELLAGAAERSAAQLWPGDWLALARWNESRGDFAAAAASYRRFQASLEGTGEDTRWVDPRVKLLDLASRAAPSAGGSSEARLALVDGRAALARGDGHAGREKLGYALRLDPTYAEAAIALGALDAQAGRSADAIREYRVALAADPARVEASVPLSNLLWDHPDRASKAESLVLLDRAAAARSDLPSLRRRSAERWAEWGDPAAALERLDAWRVSASDAERKQTDAFRAELAGRAPAVAAGAGKASASRPKIDPPARPTPDASASGVWAWGAGVAVLVAALAAVLARRRRGNEAERASESQASAAAKPAPIPRPAGPVPPTTQVDVEDLSRLLQSAAEERQMAAPPLSTRGFPADGQAAWTIRVPRPDWERLWRTVFAATLSAMRASPVGAPRLAVFGSLVREASFPASSVRFALADNAPGTLTTEMIRARAAGTDWAAVEELVRAYKGSIAVAPSIDRQFTKRVLIELPAGPA